MEKEVNFTDDIVIYGITVLTKKSNNANTFEERYLNIAKYWYALQPYV